LPQPPGIRLIVTIPMIAAFISNKLRVNWPK
jgi:hypothetical protein